ncbi:MAG: hypothetical protein QOJ70_3220 [Acidobacteriota bacterium]|jgi:hypothetical protein|nr:hypothetical protein [Acidobacteriota bacterium]MDT7809407.1 hypothetical protein [Acidobacteriota bacterium]
MPVIINDFEIEVEPQPQPQSRGNDGGREQPSSQASSLSPEDVTSVMRVNRERIERVRAD